MCDGFGDGRDGFASTGSRGRWGFGYHGGQLARAIRRGWAEGVLQRAPGAGRKRAKVEVQRIWAARGLRPYRVQTFKLSNDPRFEEKLVDVVGLYLNPPDNAIVLCMDETAQTQLRTLSSSG